MERSQKSPQSMMKELADKFWEMVESSAEERHVRNQSEKKRTPTIREFLSGWSLEELREICPAFDEDIYEAISMDTCVNKRLTIGAPGKEAMEKVIAIYRNDLSESDEI